MLKELILNDDESNDAVKWEEVLPDGVCEICLEEHDVEEDCQ